MHNITIKFKLSVLPIIKHQLAVQLSGNLCKDMTSVQ